jgi:PPM family protein phosphatase
MPPWRTIISRLHQPALRHDSGAATAPLPELHESSEAQAQDNAFETQPLGETTSALRSAEPRLTAVASGRAFAAAALRDVGRERTDNQDRCYAQIISYPGDESEHALGLFVVADGMGGHHDGGRAASIALATVVRHTLTDMVAPFVAGARAHGAAVLTTALQAANAAVFAAAHADGSDMGTTCTAALLIDRELTIAHVGDSRALVIGGGARVLTTDHTSVGRLLAIGAITPDEARDHPLRNQLYRCVGQQPHVSVEIVSATLRDESHLLLCSDGLWSLVPNDEITEIVTESPSPEVAARRLIARANLLGGHDNIAVVVAALPPAGGPA